MGQYWTDDLLAHFRLILFSFRGGSKRIKWSFSQANFCSIGGGLLSEYDDSEVAGVSGFLWFLVSPDGNGFVMNIYDGDYRGRFSVVQSSCTTSCTELSHYLPNV